MNWEKLEIKIFGIKILEVMCRLIWEKKFLYSCKWNGFNFRFMLVVGKLLVRKLNVIYVYLFIS